MKIVVIPGPNESKFKAFCRKVGTNVKESARDAGRWFKDNKETILVFGPLIIGLTTATVKAVGKHINLHKEENVKNLYCYDRSLGHYWALRRELSNKEWLEIDARKKKGERLSDILAELKVLK